MRISYPGFDFKEDIGRISFMILELDKKTKELEFEYSQNLAEKAEKKKNYIKAIHYYQECLDILKKDGIFEDTESRIKKFDKKLGNLQKHL